MSQRSSDWYRQAEKDLNHAEHSIKNEDFEWACFAAQQAVEKAIKAVYEKDNESVRGHSILGLLKGLSDKYEIPEDFYSYARVLSRYYIETRYTNGFPEGAPLDYFDNKLAVEAVHDSKKILEWCRNIILEN